MKTKYLKDYDALYDGSQLRSLFAYLEFGVLGDSILAWRSGCDVSFAHMVDGEDLRSQSKIFSTDMIHFVVEIFDRDLAFGVCVQRLMSAIVAEILQETVTLNRRGDDLYSFDKKLNISIATKSPVSTLVHYGINVSSKKTPVSTLSLDDLGVDADSFVEEFLTAFSDEYLSIVRATQKVRPVG